MILKVVLKNGKEFWGFATYSRYKKDEDIRPGFNKYGIRHADEDWSEPATLAKSIWVNHYADVQTKADLSKLIEEAGDAELEIDYVEEHTTVLRCPCSICDTGITIPKVVKSPETGNWPIAICSRCGATLKQFGPMSTDDVARELHTWLAGIDLNKDAIESTRKVVEQCQNI